MNVNTATWTVTTDDLSLVPITATVSKTVAPDTTGFVTYNANTMVLVTLTGPDKSSTNTGATAPLAYTNTTSGKVVNITITGSNGTNMVAYPFSIKRWFINRNNTSFDYIWCNGLSGIGNYELVEARMLTNAEMPTFAIPTGTSSGNYHQCVVNEGLFSEWGEMVRYFGSGFVQGRYHTINAPYVVETKFGRMGIAPHVGYLLCATP